MNKSNMKRPVVGVTPLVNDEKKRWWILPAYMDMLERAGALTLLLPLEISTEEKKQLLDICDGFLFTGGHDVNPARYHEAVEGSGPQSPERDALEEELLPLILEADKPFLGICRGMQLLNALLGGSLWQDLPSQRPTEIQHRMAKPYDADAHKVTVLPDTPLAELVGAGERGVNSLHHQAIRDLAKPLRAAAVSEDGLIEAVWMPGKRFVLGVQWHPEFRMEDELSRKLAEAFTEACRE